MDCHQTTLECKWGMDGSSGHSRYKQVFQTEEHGTDEFLFFIALVPLRLVDKENCKTYWENPGPSSTLYCRQVKFLYYKENAQLVKYEEAKMVDLLTS